MLAQAARNDLVGGAHEQVADLMREPPRVHIGKGRGFLHLRERHDEVRIEFLPRDGEILDGAHRLHAVVRIVGNFQITQKIMFGSHHIALLYTDTLISYLHDNINSVYCIQQKIFVIFVL